MTNDFVVKFTSDVSSITKDLDKFKNKTVNVKVRADGTKSVTSLNKAFNDTSNKVNVAIKQVERFDKTGKSLGVNTSVTAKNIETLGNKFLDITKKVVSFGGVTAIIAMFTDSIYKAIDVVKNFDSALTEMGKVSDYSGEKLKKFTRDLADMGSEVGRTMTEMTEATTGWIKAGYSEEDASQLARFSALLQNTADEQLEASEATAILVSQLKAYNMDVKDTIDVLDVLNNVSANQAVSSGDIAKGLTQASASLATYNNDLYETTALLTAGTTIFQGKSQQVARGLNQIANRVVKNKDALKQYGVEVYDASGNLKSTYEILKELATGLDENGEKIEKVTRTWNNLSKAEQVSLGTTLAGTNQYKVFSAVMSQMEVAQEAYKNALESSGTTMKQNNIYMESLEAKIKALKAEFEKFVIGNGGLQSFVKGAVELGTNILKLINNLGGLPTILMAIASTIAIIKGYTVESMVVGIMKAVGKLIPMITSLSVAYKEGALVITTANTAMQASIPIFGLILVGLTALYGAYKAHNNQIEENRKKTIEQINSLKEEIDSLKTAREELNKENLSRAELNGIVEKNISKYSDEISAIKDVNEARLKAINLIEEERRANAQSIVDKGLSAYLEAKDQEKSAKASEFGLPSTTKKNLYTDEDIAKGQSNIFKAEGINELKVAYEDYLKVLNESLIELRDNGKEGSLAYKDIQKEIGYTTTSLENLEETEKSNKQTIEQYDNALAILGKKYDENKEKIVSMNIADIEMYKATKNNTNAINEQSEAIEEDIDDLDDYEQRLELIARAHDVTRKELKEWSKEIGMSAEGLIDYADSMGVSVENAYKIQASFKSINTTIDDLQNSYKTLSGAIDEYNNNGYYSLDTMQALLSMSPEYLGMLKEENGVLSLNEQAIQSKILAQAQEAQQTIYNTAIERLNQLATQGSSDSTGALSNEKSGSVVSINEQTQALENNSIALIKNAQAYAINKNIAKEQAQGVIDDMKAQLDVINKAVKGMGNLSGAMGGNTSATKGNSGAHKGNTSSRKENTDAIKEQTEALEKQKKALEEEKKALEDFIKTYEKALDYLADKLKEKIEKIEKTRDDNLDKLKENAEKIAGVYEEEKTVIGEILDKVKEKHENTLDDINDLFKEAESNYRNDMDAIIDDWDSFLKRLGDYDAFEEKGILAFEEEELDVMEKELKNVQSRIDYLNEQKAHVSSATEKALLEDEIEDLEKKEGQLYANIFARKSELELEKIEANVTKKIHDLEIKKLKEEQKAIKDEYDEKIKSQEESNKELEKQLKLQEALEKIAKSKAKRVMIYKNGSWQYQENEAEVSSAQENYAEIKREEEKTAITNQLKEEQARRIAEVQESIDELTKESEKSYEQQIKDLENYLQAVKKKHAEENENYRAKITERNKDYQIELANLHEKVKKENEEYNSTKKTLDELAVSYDKIKEKYEAQLKPLNDLLKKVQEIKKEMTDKDGKNAFEKVFEVDAEKMAKNWETITKKLDGFKKIWKDKLAQIEDIDIQIKDVDKLINNLKNVANEANKTATALSNLKAQGGNPSLLEGNNDDKDKGKNGTNYSVYYKPWDDKEGKGKIIYTTLEKALEARGTIDKNTHPIVQVQGGYVITNGVHETKDSESKYGQSSDAKIWSRKASSNTVWYDKNTTKTFASGTASVRGNQVAITGEDPNREIVLGSKANGVLTSIDNGGGVINASGTRTLAGLFNALGQFSSSNFGNGNGVLNTNNSNRNSSITIGTINLPNVQNGVDFVDYLQNFSLDMVQASF